MSPDESVARYRLCHAIPSAKEMAVGMAIEPGAVRRDMIILGCGIFPRVMTGNVGEADNINDMMKYSS
jgi:hypothetical protein